ncbi:MAG TPA: hypothetical protein PKW95_15735 [bacterium]|nr:hypothetical protein [bacterium]
MVKRVFSGFMVIPLLFIFLCVRAPIASAGSYTETGIDKDDAAIIGWATGYQDYYRSDGGTAYADPTRALGVAEGVSTLVVSLGDVSPADDSATPGEITLTFDETIGNGDGYDIAVFENGFGSYPDSVFLELAYVEVSTDGETFARFPSISTIPYNSGGFNYFDVSDCYNLAGKQLAGVGSPFDLEELAGEPEVLSGEVDLQNINYVKIVDIPGYGTQEGATTGYLDSLGNPIHDNWPTGGSGGFDLDAVGYLHVGSSSGLWDDYDVTYWAGTGANEAVLVVDWGSVTMMWGYRWDGSATGQDMMAAIDEASERFYAEYLYGGAAVYGIGWDADGDGFSKTDADDYYEEGWSSGYWSYWLSTDGRTWSYSSVGFAGRTLSNGCWDGWSWPTSAPNNIPNAVKLSEFKAVPGMQSVSLYWSTSLETENAGWNIYRTMDGDSAWLKINDRPIEPYVYDYEYVDDGLKKDVAYCYTLESVAMDGSVQSFGPECATPFGPGSGGEEDSGIPDGIDDNTDNASDSLDHAEDRSLVCGS